MKYLKKLIAVLCLIACSTILFSCEWFVWQNDDDPTVNNNAGINRELNENDTLTLLMESRAKIRNSNVYIETNLYNVWGSLIYDKVKNLGSGVIIAEDTTSYYALSNYHVISKDDYAYAEYVVTTIHNVRLSANVVYQDSTKDMAIIKFEKEGDALSLIDISARKDVVLSTDEFLLAVGNPGGVKNTVTYGKFIGMANISNVSYSVIHHNALINPGNSGGALCDIDGNLVGLNTWGTENKDDNNYAIPLYVLRAFLTSAKSAGQIPTTAI